MQTRRIIAAVAAVWLAVWQAAPACANPADDQFRVAAAHYAQHRWKFAAAEFRGFLSEFPQDDRSDRARLFLGESLMQLRDFAAAEPIFRTLCNSVDAEFARKALFRASEASYLLGRWADAQGGLKAFVDQYPDDELCRFALPYLGQIALLQNHPEEADEHFRLALERFPQGPLVADCDFGRARSCEALGCTDDARQRYRTIVAAEGPRAGDAQYRLATLEHAAGDYAAAIRSFAAIEQRIAKAAPAKPSKVAAAAATVPSLADKARLGRARALYAAHQLDDAVTLLKTMVESPTVGLDARYWLGLSYKAGHDWEQTQQVLLKLADDPLVPPARRAEACLHAGESMLSAGQTAQAEAAFELALASSPTAQCRLSCLLGKLQVLLLDGKYRELAEHGADFQLAADGEKEFQAAGHQVVARGLIAEGRKQHAAGQLDAAKETLARALSEFATGNLAAEAALLRGQVLEQAEDLDGAAAMYAQAAVSDPKSSHAESALLQGARLHVRRKEYSAAGQAYAQLLERKPEVRAADVVLYEWAWAMREGGDAAQSQTLFERVRKEHPHSPLTADATYRLAESALREQAYDRADELLKAVAAQEKSPELEQHVWYLQGQLAVARQQWAEVDAPLAQLLKKYPDSELALASEFWIAEADYRSEKFDLAAERLDRLATRTTDEQASWAAMIPLRRAQILAQRGQWLACIELAQGIEEKYAAFAEQHEADYLLGRAFAARAQFEQARKSYLKVVRSTTGDKTETAAMAQWMIGETYLHQQRPEAALAEYLKVEILYPYPKWQAAALLQAGKCQELLEQPDDAAETYDRLLKVEGQTPFHAEAAERLRQLRR